MKLMNKLVIGLVLASALGSSAFAQARIGTIDLNRVISKYWKTQEAKTLLESRRAEMSKDLDKTAETGKKVSDEYQALVTEANDKALSSEQRDKSKKAAEEKFKEIRKLQDQLDRDRRQYSTTLQEEESRTFARILEEIRNVISAKAKEAGYTLVIDTSAQSARQTPVVVYNSGDANDLTDKVIEDLDRTRSPSAGGSSNPPAMTPKK
jgi:outer membrane protein